MINNERVLAVLRKIESLADFPELVEVVALADEMEAELRSNREHQERFVAEARAKVGKFFKERDRMAFMEAPAPDGKAAIIYRAVTGCDAHGQLRIWSFVRQLNGTLKVELNDGSGIFGCPGEEITEFEFRSAALELYHLLKPLLLGYDRG
jgi:hypothetical protein